MQSQHHADALAGGDGFGETYFAHARLGDARRTRRLVDLANKIVKHPGGTLPHKLRDPAELTALYRLCRADAVTHEAVAAAAVQPVRRLLAESMAPLLVLHDSTEFDYTEQRSLTGLGKIGNGGGRGYVVHNSLVVDPRRREAIGLAGQILHHRAEVPPDETRAQKRARENRESRLWLRGTEGLPASRNVVDVCDRGADTFEFLESECRSGRRFVVRSGYRRRVLPGHVDPEDGPAESVDLHAHVQSAAAVGTHELPVPRRRADPRAKKRKDGSLRHPPRTQRTAKLEVAIVPLRLRPPKATRGEYGNRPLPVWLVRVREPRPPAGEEPLEWLLWTNSPVTTLEEAVQIVDWYACRWIVEEFHKAVKTGCDVEALRFQYEERLEPVIALLSVVAVQLLRLRDAARAPDARTRPATDVVAEEYVEALALWRHKRPRPDWSVWDFTLALGRLGGHQNRRSDGPPGWLTLWRGWTELAARTESIHDARASRRCA